MMSSDTSAVLKAQSEEIAALKKELELLKVTTSAMNTTFYASSDATGHFQKYPKILPTGRQARFVKEFIVQYHELDFKPRLNTSSYVNVVSEPEEQFVARLGAEVNLADASVYAASIKLHDAVVSILCQLWHAPSPSETGDETYQGAGTVGSTEACLLAGLAHKFRWRKWYAKRHGLTPEQVLGIQPNLVISTCFQAAWEKLFRFFDVTPRFIQPSVKTFTIDPSEIAALCDDKTMAVVGILGNHYNGAYDPIWDIDKAISKINAENGFQIGIHVDAASGGFIAPFQDGLPPFDFRLPNVLTFSSSGHKFGESLCGTGWLAFRHKTDLAEHVSTTVSYLGGKSSSMTLNFSRPASGPYVQLYKLARLGEEGYRSKVGNQMFVAKIIRDALREMRTPDGKPRFEVIDGGDVHCLPVVGARMNPQVHASYDDIDLQHALSESHWYVSGYKLSFDNPITEVTEPLFKDEVSSASMFRIVCKSNLTGHLAENLITHIRDVLPVLDSMKAGYASVKTQKAILTAKMTNLSDVGHGHHAC